MDHNYSQDDEDFGGRVVYGDDANNHDSEDQSQDERDAEVVVHSRYDIAARRRLGLVAEEQDPSVLLGSEDLARNLQQHRSPLPTNLKQNFNTILQQYYEPDAAPQPSPAFRRTDEAHGDYSPAAQRLNLQTAANSPATAYSPHAHAESPAASARLTAASQAAGVPPAAGKFRPRPAAAPPAPYLGGAGVVTAGGIEVDEELLNAFQVHKATSPNSKKRDTRKFHHQGSRRGAAPPSFNAGAATMATPVPSLGANNNPLLSLLASAKGNASGGRGGRGSGGGGNAGSGGTPRQPSNFRQPAIGTPVGGYGATTGVAVAGPSRFQREQQRNVAHAATPAAAAVTPAPALPDQQQDTILSSDEEGNELNPAPITGAARNMATPIGAQGIGGAAAPGSGGSAGRLTGPQDSFLAGLAPPSTRAAHGNVRSRLGGGASGSGLQGRLKRARMADEIAAAASNGSNTHTVEAIIQTCSVECNVFKVRGLCHNSAIVDFFLPSPSLAQRADLAAGRKIVIRYPFRKVSTSNDGIELYFCTGEVFGQQNSN